jgi:hypothetical protein
MLFRFRLEIILKTRENKGDYISKQTTILILNRFIESYVVTSLCDLIDND